jgi:glycosyltransferase involved in cell wall biosynthesis
MRVVLNGLAALKPKTGVGHHVAGLYTALRGEYPADQFTLFPGDLVGQAAKRIGRTITAPSEATRATRPRLTDRLRAATKSIAKFGSRCHFTGFTRMFGFDLYHEPNFVPFPSHLPTVVTVHDLSVLKYPQWHPADRVVEHQKHFLRGLDRARHIIVVSHAVRRELIEELNCPPERVTTVYNGVGPQFHPQPSERIRAVRAKWDLPDNFFLCVGTIEPRKNLGTVIRAFADLPAEVRSAYPLVLVGPWGWRSEADHELYQTVGRPAGVRHFGYVSADDLPALYSAAHALLYPSHYEGFGFPPVEMLACGGAVIASTADAVCEVVGGHATFVEPEDTAGWRDALYQSVSDPSFLSHAPQRGVEHAGQYNWRRAACETVAVYNRVLGVPVQRPIDLPRFRGLAA